MSGNDSFKSEIAGITQANPCVISTTEVHGYQTKQLIRVSDLDTRTPVARGMSSLDGNRYRITVLSTTSFSLQNPLTNENIDSTGFDAWVSDGKVNLETRTLSLNNPQVRPYSDTNQYVENPFFYKP